jgi:chromosome segregation ATPase
MKTWPKAQEEAAKSREDHTALLAHVKELEALNVQIGLVSARVETLESEVVTLKETIQSRDETLSGTDREIETLRAIIHDRDEALRAAEKAHSELCNQIMGW